MVPWGLRGIGWRCLAGMVGDWGVNLKLKAFAEASIGVHQD